MPHWVSVIPFLVVIPLAIWTKRVLPAITIGVITGGYLLSPGFISGMETAVHYIVKALTDTNNMKVILFLYVFTGLVGIIKQAGGIKGFVARASERIQTKRSALFLTWISTVGTFAAPSFRIVTIGPIMRSLLHKIKMTPQELGFVIETTGTAVIVLIPIATAFVGYMSSVIDLSLKNEQIVGDSYQLFIKSIPFNFFSFAIIILGIYLSFFHKDKEKKVPESVGPENEKQAEAKGYEDCHPAVAKDLPEKPLNLILPIASTIILTLVLTFWSGLKQGGHGFGAFIKADVLDAMLIALVITTILSFIFFMIQKFKLNSLLDGFISSANGLMSVILLLSVVWGLSLVTNKLGLADFISGHVSWIPSAFIPPVLFLLGCAISYFIGSAWGTWGIVMPIGISLAHLSGASLPIVIGAVFASGSFGAFTSPLSDDTNTMAGILDMKAVPYAHFKLKSGLFAAAAATVAYGLAAFI